jgi:hypothetical protein
MITALVLLIIIAVKENNSNTMKLQIVLLNSLSVYTYSILLYPYDVP